MEIVVSVYSGGEKRIRFISASLRRSEIMDMDFIPEGNLIRMM